MAVQAHLALSMVRLFIGLAGAVVLLVLEVALLEVMAVLVVVAALRFKVLLRADPEAGAP